MTILAIDALRWSLFCLCLLFTACAVGPACAAGGAGDAAERHTYQLAPLTVVDRPLPNLEGGAALDAGTLRQQPARKGGITDALHYLPEVQFSEEASQSGKGGEILPPTVSIAGGRTYDTRFLVDGLGTNNVIDPTASIDSYGTPDRLPGHPQGLLLNTHLLSAVTVLESNIPAKFGNFTGGVILSDTRSPKSRLGMELHGRTTRDAWTQTYLSDEDRARFENSSSHELQPRFQTWQGGAEIDVPYGGGGLLLAYDRSWSDIEIKPFGEKRHESRRLENLLLKQVLPVTDGTLTLSAFYVPYSALYVRPNAIHSDIHLDHDTTELEAKLVRSLSFGTLTLTGGLSWLAIDRQAPQDFFSWRNLPSTNWGETGGYSRSNEGGYGDLEMRQGSLSFSADVASRPYRSAGLDHVVNGGLDYQLLYGRYRRPQDSTYYYSTVESDTVVCAEGDPACIDGEQYANRKWIYPVGNASATAHQLAVYLEDTMRWARLQVRPGLRLSYDDVLNNLNPEPRLAASLDLFGGGDTLLVTGINRYYGQSLLTYAIREGIQPKLNSTRTLTGDTPGAWSEPVPTLSTIYRTAKLNTPFADEWTAGVRQALLGGELGFNYLNRRYQDEFAYQVERVDGINVRTLNNEGHRRFEKYSLSWQRRWGRHDLYLGISYRHSRGSVIDYESMLDPAADVPVIFEGEVISRSDLPQEDFNREWNGSIVYTLHLPRGVTFTQAVQYRSPYQDIVKTGEEEGLSVYERKKLDATIQLDWLLRWERKLGEHRGLALELELYNVLSDQVELGTSSDTNSFETGRQLWAGLECWF